MNRDPKPSSLRSLVPAVVFMGLALGMSLLIYNRFFTSYDDGIAAEGARLVLQGKVPYKDFWALYAPGSYYANALLFAVFGESFLAIRMAILVMIIVQAGFVWGILRRVTQRTTIRVVACTSFLAFIPIGISITCPITYWLTFSVAAIYCLVRWIEDPTPRWEYKCGLLMGVAALFRQDGGLYTAVAVIVLMWLICRRMKTAARTAGAFSAVVGITVAWFACKGALPQMYDDTVRFALTVFPHSRKFPYPVPWHKALIMARYYSPQPIAFIFRLYTFWLMPAVLAVFAAVSAWRLLRAKAASQQAIAAALACLAAILFAMVSVRPVGLRVAGAAVVSVLMFAAYSSDRVRALRVTASIMLVGALVAFCLYGAAELWGQSKYGSHRLVMKGGIYVGRGYGELLGIVSAYVRDHTSPGEKILSGTPSVYFMASRDPATRYFEPHPCLTDTPAVQRTIIRDMQRERVRYFVRSGEWQRDGYFTIERQNQPRMLIDYIERNYKPVLRASLLDVYERTTPFR